MKNIYNLLVLVLGVAVMLGACSTEDDLIQERKDDNPLISDPDPSGMPGSADFSKYIAIGNSLTAGYMDGALYDDGQANSFANILGKQFQIMGIGGGDFNQPNINSVKGFNTVVANPDPVTGDFLGRFELDLTIPGPVASVVTVADQIALGTPYSGPALNNFGAPGILLGQLLTPATGGPMTPTNPAYNPYYARFASNPSVDGATGSTILGDALAAQPTFFTMWIGNNDLLGYAISGASNEAIFTSAVAFDFQYNTAVDGLLNGSTAKGVLINIPPILALPFFRAVPFNPLPLTDQASVDALNAAYAAYNAGLDMAVAGMAIDQAEADRRKISFALGANSLVIIDEDLTDLDGLGLPNYRQTVATDLLPLSTAAAIPTGVGSQIPAEDQFVITIEEQSAINARFIDFNTTIATAAAGSDRLALYDTNALDGAFLDLFGITDGVIGVEVDGFNYQPDFSPNGVFSTDGVHPNPKGHAIVANEVIKVINATFGASIPQVDIVPFRTVLSAQ